MTLYRLSNIMLVLSAFCLAVSVGLGSEFYILMSTICVLLSGQLYASAVIQETGEPPLRRHR